MCHRVSSSRPLGGRLGFCARGASGAPRLARCHRNPRRRNLQKGIQNCKLLCKLEILWSETDQRVSGRGAMRSLLQHPAAALLLATVDGPERSMGGFNWVCMERQGGVRSMHVCGRVCDVSSCRNCGPTVECRALDQQKRDIGTLPLPIDTWKSTRAMLEFMFFQCFCIWY